MKRWLLAVAALFGCAWTCAQADYVLIVYDLGVPKNKGDQTPGMQGFQGGAANNMQDMMRRMQGGMGRMGGPGGEGPGAGGAPGRPGNLDQMRRAMQGQGGGPQPGAAPGGFQGGQPGGGRFGAGPGGRFGQGMNPLGGQGGMGAFGNLFGNQNLQEPDDEDTTLKVSAVVEVKKWDKDLIILPKTRLQRADQYRKFTHQWGHTALYDTGDISFHVYNIPPRDLAYKKKREVLLGKDGSDKNANNYLDLAKWALTNGKVDEFPNIMDELSKIEEDNPVVAAFKKVKAEIDRKITKDDTRALAWQSKLSNYKLKVDAQNYPHYVLLYSPPSSGSVDSQDVLSRMKRLEENYRAFFYWFALKGKVLPVPDFRLVTVLVDSMNEYQDLRKAFDSVPTADDGFYDRREDLVFLSATPQDEGYDALDKSTKDLWSQGWTRQDLLEGKTKSPPNSDSVTIVRNQVKTLLLRALENESELAAVSHEGTMQLASVTGLIPRTVSAPDWVQFGTASFFETPKGAWWQGTGAPSHLYLKKFQDWDVKKKLDTPPETALKKVITDEYFREARKSNQDAAWTKARTMTWALTFFLFETHLDELMAYYQELGKLPRDMEFDDEILMGCFARAFKIADSANPNQPKQDALHRLGMDWYKYLADTKLENMQAQKEAEDARMNTKKGAGKKNTKAKEKDSEK